MLSYHKTLSHTQQQKTVSILHYADPPAQPLPRWWSAFWAGTQAAQFLIDGFILVAMLVCDYDNDFMPEPLWFSLMVLQTVLGIFWACHYVIYLYQDLNYYPPFKIIYLGSAANAFFAMIFFIIAYTMNLHRRRRMLEFVVIYPVSQLTIYLNYAFTYWNWNFRTRV